MTEDKKKRKPSRDFPAHAQVPVGKHVTVHLDLHETAASTVPPMRDPFHTLHGGAMRANRTLSMISMDSVGSVVSVDDGFRVSEPGEYPPDEERASLSLPKDERPPQPPGEREYFERLWAENFERSEAQVANTTAYIPVSAAGRLNRIKGFSFARDAFTHRLYAVFRLEVECIVSEKQWTIYRRFHDFKQLAHQLKNESVRVPTVPTRTLMRSLDATFLRKRQSELDRWLREVLMLVSLENCKVDTDKAAECCGNRGFHSSCRLIRHFLTHSANEPPVFEHVELPGGSAAGRPPLFSISEYKAPPSPSSLRATSFLGVPSAAQIDLLSSSLRASDLMGAGAHVHHYQQQQLETDEHQDHERASEGALREQRRSVVVEDADELAAQPVASRKDKVTLKHFDVLRMIGRGSFGKVLLVRKKNSSQLFAVKILNKPAIVKKQQVEHTRTERRVLASVTHPFVVCLHYAFQTREQLYFVLDYCPGGDLFFHLSRCGCFPEPMAKFYAAEIVLALIHLHEQGIVYRDLKPENIMLDVEGHVKLADFGLAKEGIVGELDGTYTMCGTPEYLPPEILNRAGHGTAVDWWNLGMVLYEMLTGRPPWYTQDREELFQRLREAELEFPDGVGDDAMDLIRGLLTRDPAKRLGAIDPREITYHPFFGDIDWNLLYQRQVEPLYRPCQFTDPIDAANFEEEFTKLPLAQIDGHGLNVAPQFDPAAHGAGGGGGPGGATGRPGSVSAGGGSARHSTLRNMSYTFAGFTYDGSSSLARSSLDQSVVGSGGSLSPVNGFI